MRLKRIAFFMPGLGCARKCVYCDQNVITLDSGDCGIAVTPEEVRRAVARVRAPVELCYFGGSFAGTGIHVMTEFLEVIRYAAEGSAVTFSSYPGDFDGPSGREIIRILKNYPIGTIELGIPSLDPKVLEACRRDDDAGMIIRVINLLIEGGFNIGVQLMMGLPRQNAESVINDVKALALLMPKQGGADFRLYPCLVIKGTELEAMYKRGEYIPLELENAVRTAGVILFEAERYGFNVIRVGLLESETLKKSVIAGPYHPAFGELAISEKLALSLFDASPRGTWSILRRNISQLTGHGGRGIRRLSELTGIPPEEVKSLILI